MHVELENNGVCHIFSRSTELTYATVVDGCGVEHYQHGVQCASIHPDRQRSYDLFQSNYVNL